jgi:hypothetical protein
LVKEPEKNRSASSAALIAAQRGALTACLNDAGWLTPCACPLNVARHSRAQRPIRGAFLSQIGGTLSAATTMGNASIAASEAMQRFADAKGELPVPSNQFPDPGNKVRITGQLIDSTTGAHLWADRFDGGSKISSISRIR